ncbi:MAG: GntR family transcriptional regulator [Mangrovibacterium sp.]
MSKTISIQFDENLAIPKYRQIIDAISDKIKKGELKKGDRIPSLNMLCKQYGLSQDTVLMAYNELKTKGIITSQVGKGYFIQNVQVDIGHKVLLLFDKLTAYKEDLYEAFKAMLNGHGTEQIFFHHNNLKLFQAILEGANGEFSEYVIMPIPGKEAADIISRLPERKVYILDQGREQYRTKYPFVCQDFERDIYRMLKQHSDELNHYTRIVLVIRNQRATLREIAVGFRDFCIQKSVLFEITTDLTNLPVHPNDLFIVVDDKDLEYLVRYALDHKLQLGKDLGIISYNESSIKGIVATGITTISTDFTQMGKSMAEMILNNKREKIDNPFVINRRSSF